MHWYSCNNVVHLLNKVKSLLLNQERAWFLEIAFVREVGMRVCVWMCVCVRPRGHE